MIQETITYRCRVCNSEDIVKNGTNRFSLTVLLVGLGLGFIINLPGWTDPVLLTYLKTFFITGFLAFLLCPPIAFFASVGRGYLAPLGFVVFTLVIAQIIAALGLGAYFPWAVPGLFSGMAGAEQAQVPGFSYIILGITSIAGFWVRWAGGISLIRISNASRRITQAEPATKARRSWLTQVFDRLKGSSVTNISVFVRGGIR